ncbi:hypothetical protein OEZ85_008037 [Tetradesmus obliquus]|uniref:Uncharacterized protein n=2 Tax=Tetradesmus obliquus TaxID=3088 RepID=A0A383VVJ4_TETOB|nr:hypothetical protein OEZ85_008037 [Tetradesmus obliquus]|eukprot:jgi/Sobl393_1/13225/SZX68802.1
MFGNSRYRITGTGTRDMGDGSIKITNRAGFSVQYYPNYKIIVNEVAKETYLMYQCGCYNRTRAFPANLVPADTGFGKAKVFEGPLQSISADDTSVGEFMNQCAVIDRVMYVTEYGVNGCYQRLGACGYTAPDPGWGNDADKITQQVDAYITYGATKNTKSIAMSAVAASTPLTRSEWLKYFGAFFNKEYEAETLFRAIRNNYNALKRDAQGTRPNPPLLVAWVYLGFSGDYVVSKPPYKVAYVEDAGGAVVSDDLLRASGFTTKDGQSWSIPQAYPEDWAAFLNQVDVIIDESYTFATACYVRLGDFLAGHKLTGAAVKAVTNRQVYTIAGMASQTLESGTVGLDWYERGTARADEVLRDFVRVLNPANAHSTMNNWNRRWLLRLNGETQKRQAPVCDNKTANLNSKCQRETFAFAICPNVIRNCTDGRIMVPGPAKRCEFVQQQKQAIRQLTNQGKRCNVPGKRLF